jgi:hypothetical protein
MVQPCCLTFPAASNEPKTRNRSLHEEFYLLLPLTSHTKQTSAAPTQGPFLRPNTTPSHKRRVPGVRPKLAAINHHSRQPDHRLIILPPTSSSPGLRSCFDGFSAPKPNKTNIPNTFCHPSLAIPHRLPKRTTTSHHCALSAAHPNSTQSALHNRQNDRQPHRQAQGVDFEVCCPPDLLLDWTNTKTATPRPRTTGRTTLGCPPRTRGNRQRWAPPMC